MQFITSFFDVNGLLFNSINLVLSIIFHLIAVKKQINQKFLENQTFFTNILTIACLVSALSLLTYT